MAATDYQTGDLELLREIVQRGESRLQAQLTLDLAADQRALIFAGFIAAITVALAGGVCSLAIQGQGTSFMYIGGIVSVALGVAMLLAVGAARPVPWFIPGSTPKSWIADVRDGVEEGQRLAALLDDMNDRIEANDALIVSNAAKLEWSANIVAATTILGAGSALIAASTGG